MPAARSLSPLAVLIALLGTLLAVPAGPAAAAPVPPPVDYGPGIDAYSSYQAESTCSPTEKPGAQQLRDLLRRTYGSGIATNIVRSCSASESGHEEGRSVDWMTNARDAEQRDIAESFIGWLRGTDRYGNRHAMARRTGVMYVIWNNRMWRSYDPDRVDPEGVFGGGWTTYAVRATIAGKSVRTPCTAPEVASTAYDNSCHRNHVHISLGWDGALARTSYYTFDGAPACAPSPATGAAPATGTTRLRYVGVTPTRLLDTRSGLGTPSPCRVAPGASLDVQVTGRGPVPASGVAAVVLNLTAVAKDRTWVSAHPAGADSAGTSSLNVAAGATRAALVSVPVGAAGRVTLQAGSGATHLLADVVGYYPSSGAGEPYEEVGPQRLLDTRASTALGDGETRQVAVRGRAGVSTGARSVVLNVTVTRPSTGGYVSVTPSGGTATSSVNFAAGQTVANRVIVPLASDGTVAVYSSAAAHVVLDVAGWYGASSTATRYVPLAPARLLDTRTSAADDTLVEGDALSVRVAGRAGVPVGARSVVVTLTGTRATAPTHLTAWAGGEPTPAASDLNLVPGEDAANLAIVPVAADGTIRLQTNAGTTDTLVDVLGYHR